MESTPTKLFVPYWRSGCPVVNFGDYLNMVLLEKLGVKAEPYYKGCNLLPGARCLMAIGTILDSDWFNRTEGFKEVWGSGYGGDRSFLATFRNNSIVHAVRGPLTRDALRLPISLPIGDPALLLPRFIDPVRRLSRGVTYIPHFHDTVKTTNNTLREIGADGMISMAIMREDFHNCLEKIVSSDFVLTSSLHGAIVAQAYKVPWALCVPKNFKLDKPFKWQDWFAYLGIHMVFCANYGEARSWWRMAGRNGEIRDLDDLLAAFPY